MPFAKPLDHFTNALQLGMVLTEAQAVILMRVMGKAGIWSVTPAEDDRMVYEKLQAVTRANIDATRTAIQGGGSGEIVAAAIKPIRQKTRANARRLGKRGFKKG
ncbi:MAG: antifreeze protein [Pseudomonadota bacterium]